MTIKEELSQEIETAPEALLAETLNYLRYLKTQQSPNIEIAVEPSAPSKTPDDGKPIIRNSKLGNLLQFAGTWHGDDLEECLNLVYATRSKTRFDDPNPFE